MSSNTHCVETPVFRPSVEEFARPFCEYVERLLKKNPDLPMFKVVPPAGWKPRRSAMPKLQKLDIQCPIKQMVFGTRGSYRCILVEQKPLNAGQFREIAEDGDHVPPHKEKDALLERAFWSSVTINPPLYGADTPMSLFDEKLPYGWNLRNLEGCLLKNPDIPQVPGVTTPMTYFGMWKSFFAWHVEDADLFSINYLHFGAPKVWYCVSPSNRAKFERMAQSLYPELHKHCPAFMRHKDILLSPSLLRTYGVEYMQTKQEPNEFIVLNAGAYHAGYNLGFNCAEAVNFATERWIEIGKHVTRCKCDALAEGVRLSMRLFGCSSGSSASSSEEEGSSSGGEDEDGSGSGSEAVSSEQEEEEEAGSSQDESDEAEEGGRAPAAARRRSSAGAGAGAGTRVSQRKRTATPAGAALAGAAVKRSRRSSASDDGELRRRPAGPRKTRTALAAAASAAKVRRTHATAEARARLAVTRGRAGKRGAGGEGVGSSKASAKKRDRDRRDRRERREQAKAGGSGSGGGGAAAPAAGAGGDSLADSLQRAAAAAAAIRARAEADAANARKRAAAGGSEGPEDGADSDALPGLLTRRRSEVAGGGSAGPEDAESPRASKAKLRSSGHAALAESDEASEDGQQAVGFGHGSAARSGPPPGEAPQVIIGEEKGSRYFYLVQVLKDRKPRKRGHLVMRWLKESKDGLFRPSQDTWEEVPGALVAVRTQWVPPSAAASQGGGYRLLTLRSRILDTQLVD